MKKLKDLREALNSSKPLISDGGMTTSLYEKGFYINRSFDELSLVQVDAVREVTQGFKAAGADLLHTNTFGTTIPKLTKYGLQEQNEEILTRSVDVALEVANGECWVLGAMGPLGVVLEPLGPTARKDAFQYFKQTAKTLHDAGAHGFSLLTFHDLRELEQAALAIREVSDRPILAHISIQGNLKTSYGYDLSHFVELANILDLDVMGFNGQAGPSEILRALEKLRPLTDKPISLLPNAGLPRYVNDVYIYMCNPDYIAKYAKRMVQSGAKIVGGFSGVYEEHIRAISSAVRMLSPQQSHIELVEAEQKRNEDEEREAVALEKRSLLGQKLARQEQIVSVELMPPMGIDCSKFFERCQELEEGGVEFVNIPDGARAMARMSSMHMAAYISENLKLEPIPHYTTRDRNLLALQADLVGSHINGVRNVLLVTGDPPKLGNCPDATAVYDVDAIGLTHIVSRMNHGLDLGGSSFGNPTEFVIAVALNPTAINRELEIKRFKYKVEGGAEVAVTQPIYDVEAYREFMEQSQTDIPVVMGIWPLVSLRNAEFLKHEVPGVSVPDWVISEMEKAGDDKEKAIQIGLDIARKTISEAKDFVAGFQVSAPFNRVQVALDAIREAK